jgi:copper chaperone CopZ
MTTSTTQTTEHVTLIAPDISCGHCVSTVQQALEQHEGVNRVMANAETKFVDVDFDPSLTTVESISDVLKEAGYPVKQ